MLKIFSRMGILLLLAFGLIMFNSALSQAQSNQRIPSSVEACEKRASTQQCSTWNWNGTAYDAKWTDGSVSVITISFLETASDTWGSGRQTLMAFTRFDTTGPAAGLSAVYTCEIGEMKVKEGQVNWNLNGLIQMGKWNGTLTFGSIQDKRNSKADLAMRSSMITSIAQGARLQIGTASNSQPEAYSSTPSASSQRLSAVISNLTRINNELARQSSDSVLLLGQWRDFEGDCPSTSNDELCLDGKRQVAQAIVIHSTEEIQLYDQKIALLDAGQQDASTQGAIQETEARRDNARKQRTKYEVLSAALEKSLYDLKRKRELP